MDIQQQLAGGSVLEDDVRVRLQANGLGGSVDVPVVQVGLGR